MSHKNCNLETIKVNDFESWLSKNHWQSVRKNSHVVWEYNLEDDDGKYITKGSVSFDGEVFEIDNKVDNISINFHVQKEMKRYTIKCVITFMGISIDDFCITIKKGKSIPRETLIRNYIDLHRI